MSFQSVVLTIAFFALILSLIMVGLLIKSSTSSAQFPPETSQCPDYWKAGQDNTGNIICNNTLNLGTGCPSMNISDSEYQGNSVAAITAKCNYAKNTCGVTWDGITNVINNQTGQPYC
jgi:hypothetical protein